MPRGTSIWRIVDIQQNVVGVPSVTPERRSGQGILDVVSMHYLICLVRSSRGFHGCGQVSTSMTSWKKLLICGCDVSLRMSLRFFAESLSVSSSPSKRERERMVILFPLSHFNYILEKHTLAAENLEENLNTLAKLCLGRPPLGFGDPTYA